MRKRHFALIAGLVCAAGVVAYQAVTHHEPEPFVRREAPGDMPAPPVISTACNERGEEVLLYTSSDGRQLEPVLSGAFCYSADQTTPGQ